MVVLFASLPSLTMIAEDKKNTLKCDPVSVEENPRSRYWTRQATSLTTHEVVA